jgi:hypothetical protein
MSRPSLVEQTFRWLRGTFLSSVACIHITVKPVACVLEVGNATVERTLFEGYGCVLYASVHRLYGCVLIQPLESIAMLGTEVTSFQVALSTAMHCSDSLSFDLFSRSCSIGIIIHLSVGLSTNSDFDQPVY